MSSSNLKKGTSMDGVSLSRTPSEKAEYRTDGRTSRDSKDLSADLEMAPSGQVMIGRDIDYLLNKKTLRIAQTRKGCLQELLGCEAQSEVRIFPMARAERQ